MTVRGAFQEDCHCKCVVFLLRNLFGCLNHPGIGSQLHESVCKPLKAASHIILDKAEYLLHRLSVFLTWYHTLTIQEQSQAFQILSATWIDCQQLNGNIWEEFWQKINVYYLIILKTL